MRAIARLFAAIAAWFASRASAKELALRITKLEAENVKLAGQMSQLQTDMGKCKMMVGLNQILDVTADV